MKQKLIILPGWSGTEKLWQHQCRHLADIVDVQVVVVTDQNDVEKMAQKVLEQAPERFILCGHSLGGWVAQHIAIKEPKRVSKLILLGSWRGECSQEGLSFYKKTLQSLLEGQTEKLLAEGRAWCVYPERRHDKEFMEFFKKSQEEFPVQGLINQTEAEIHSRPTTEWLHQIHAPTLLIYGRQDAVFSLQEQEEMAAAIPHAKLAIVEECGHMLSIECPQATTALMRLWIQL